MMKKRCWSGLVAITAAVVVGTALAPIAAAAPAAGAAPGPEASGWQRPDPAGTAATSAAAGRGGKPGGRLSPRLRQLTQPDIQALPPQAQAAQLGIAESGPGSFAARDGGRILVDLRLTDTGDVVRNAILASGAQIVAVSQSDPVITVSVRPEQLPALEHVPGLGWAQEVLTPEVRGPGGAPTDPDPVTNATCPTGLVSEADTQLNVATARTASAVDGTGVKVGVLSDSYNKLGGAATDVLNAELPGPTNPCGHTTAVQIQAELGSGGTDEGRAMAQAVHDLAPGSTMAFATAFNGEADFGNQIRNLQIGGAKVIVDDISYYAEPMYQDGLVAKAINDVTALGATYFSSAGNSTTFVGGKIISSYEAAGGYRATPCPAGLTYSYLDCHDFDPGAGADSDDQITVNNGGRIQLSLGWNQPQLGVTTDFDIYLVDTATNTVVASSPGDNLVSQNTFEYFNFTNSSGVAKTYKVIVGRYAGAASPRFKIIFHRPAGWTAVEWNTTSGTDIIGPSIFGHNANLVSGSIAAVPYYNSSTVETFSSRGPTTYCYGPVGAVAAAPLPGGCQTKHLDIAATDGARNSFFGQVLGDGLFHFFGTSQSAPHAAAIAALQTQARGCRTPAQILAAQRSSGRAIAGFGQADLGSGLVDATTAITGLASCSVTFTSALPPSATNVGAAYSHTFTTSGSPAPTFSVTAGSLPPGLALNGTTGALTGTPTTQGSYPATVTANNGFSAPTQSFTIVVGPRTFTVNTTSDQPDANLANNTCATATAQCSLRAAIQQANASAGSEIIILANTTYTLGIAGMAEDGAATGDLDVTGQVTVTGNGATINGAALDRVFETHVGSNVTLSNLTVTGGSAIAGSDVPHGAGGGILNWGTLTVSSVTMTGNAGLFGGAIGSGSANLNVTGSTIANNQSYFGGGILVAGGSASVATTNFTNNQSLSSGGAIWATGTVVIAGGTYSGNTSAKYAGAVGGFNTITIGGATFNNNSAQTGGAISGAGGLSIVNSVITNNTASQYGGGVAGVNTAITGTTLGTNHAANGGGFYNAGVAFSAAGVGTVTRSTLSGNTATATGGGIFNDQGATLTVDTSTLDANTATGNGGGLENRGSANVISSTVTANTGALGGGIHATAVATVTNSVLGNNTPGSNCNGTVSSGGYNLTSDTSCAFAAGGDVVNTPVLLGAMANNGGLTLTRLPQVGSPAINTGQPGCSGVDQRNVARPAGGGCNKGSVDN